ncbi:MAG: type III-B CRISPR module RAMP protein Cmr1 [Candidatus Lokiarchaeota archaeon]|nr:type III-B CRISPR module RAMP protein Cmr1 [Candidatus Lokiarchaeota archaeon]
MNFVIKTLTPLWTGGIQGAGRIYETGILGSLRWWYEAIVRGIGGAACDITNKGCEFKGNKLDMTRCDNLREWYEKLHNAGLCDACILFGTTGWRKAFTLYVSNGEKLFQGNKILLTSGHKKCKRGGQKHQYGGWYLMPDSIMDDSIKLEINNIRNINHTDIIKIPLLLIHNWANLAAKESNGYGVVSIRENDEHISISDDLLNKLPTGSKITEGFPDLREFFFIKISFDLASEPDAWKDIKGINKAFTGTFDSTCSISNCGRTFKASEEIPNCSTEIMQVYEKKVIPIASAVRSYLRFQWPLMSYDQKNYFLGTARNDGVSSKIKVSHAYSIGDNKWEFRVWGWLPCYRDMEVQYPTGDRDDFFNELFRLLNSKVFWRFIFNGYEAPFEVKEPKFLTNDPRSKDGLEYLKTLLDT